MHAFLLLWLPLIIGVNGVGLGDAGSGFDGLLAGFGMGKLVGLREGLEGAGRELDMD